MRRIIRHVNRWGGSRCRQMQFVVRWSKLNRHAVDYTLRAES